jgi:hypothetical protein
VAGVIQYVNLTDQSARNGFVFVSREAKSGNFAPYNLAWNLEIERSINRLLVVGLKYLQSQAQDLITMQPQVVQRQNALVLGSAGATRSALGPPRHRVTTKNLSDSNFLVCPPSTG